MKEISNKSTEQSRLAKSIMEENPNLTNGEIGELMGVGRERVRQLLLLEKISIRKQKKALRLEKEKCPICGKSKKETSNICVSCYRERHNVTLICEVCNKEFVRYKSQAEREGVGTPRFCSRACQGKWLGDNHGFKVSANG